MVTHDLNMEYYESVNSNSNTNYMNNNINNNNNNSRVNNWAAICKNNSSSSRNSTKTKRCLTKEQDPMSHRIIEKRRRDRMNNCLADLSRLIPAEYLKKGRGRVEKTEIIEMAIRHMKHLQGIKEDSKQTCTSSSQPHPEEVVDSMPTHSTPIPSLLEHYRLGFQECMTETVNFLIDVEGFYPRDALCIQLVNHLQQHCEKIIASGERLNFSHSELTAHGLAASFGISNSAIPTMCPNGISLVNGHTTNSIGPLSSTLLHHHQQDQELHHHHNNHPHHQHNNDSSSSLHSNGDRNSSSGVSSFSDSDPPPRPSTPPAQHQHTITQLLSTAPTSVLATSDDSNHSNHSGENQSQTPHCYKFKNSIKQRFSADQRFKLSPDYSPYHHHHHHHHHHHSQDATKLQGLTLGHHAHHQGVPIFALHDNGSFYIPLTLEADLLRPHLNNCSGAGEQNSETILHPVTISVNFNHSNNPPAWPQHPSPKHQMTAS